MTKQIPYIVGSLIFAYATAVYSATVPQTADGSDGFGAFSTSGGTGGSSGTFTGASDLGDPSWGFFASSGESSQALYDFVGGALIVGQTISFQIDNGNIQSGGTVGIGLQNSGLGNNRFEFFFVGNDTNYTYLDNGGSQDSGIGFTSSGLTLDFTLTGADTYSIDVTPLGSSTSSWTGTLGGTPGSGVDRLRFFNFNAGSGSASDFYANNISIIPEPSSLMMLGLAGMAAAGLVALKRKRS